MHRRPSSPFYLTLAGSVAALSLAGCGQRWWVCDEVSDAQLERLPERLSVTGLYTDLTVDALADAVLPYRPRFELWSDGAAKRRWLKIPRGAQIDSRDMDNWIFPEGTQLDASASGRSCVDVTSERAL